MSDRDDWIRVPYTDKQVAWAEARLAAIRAGRGDGFYRGKRPEMGFLMEGLVSSWLKRESIEHVWNGGNEGRPDIEIGAHGLAVKTRVDPPPRSEIVFRFPLKQEIPESVIFGVVETGTSTAWIAGALRRSEFLRRSRVVPAGDEIWPGFKTTIDERAVVEGDVGSAVGWLQELYVSELQHVDAA